MLLRSLLDPGDWLAMRPQLDPEATPVEFHFRPEPAEVKLRLSLGLIVLAGASAGVYFLRGDILAIFIASGFGLFGLLNLVYGILQSRFSMSLVISGLEVAVDASTLFGKRSWRESLHTYRGILLREEDLADQGSGKTQRMKRYSIVELLHSDPRRTVPLYVREDGVPPKDIQQAFALRFHLPPLAPDITGRVSTDRLMSWPDPGPPPRGVTVHEANGITCLAIGGSWTGRVAAWLFWLLLPLGAGGLVYQIEPAFAVLAAAMVAGLEFVLLGIAEVMRRRREESCSGICIGNREVWVGSVARPPLIAIPFSDIQQVRVDRVAGHPTGGTRGWIRLVVDGGDRRLEFSGGLFDRTRVEWIRNRLLYRISRRD